MNKLKNLWQNLQILGELVMEWPKTSTVLIVTVLSSVLYFGPKIPNAIGCSWDANIKYSLEDDRYRFNWLVPNEDEN